MTGLLSYPFDQILLVSSINDDVDDDDDGDGDGDGGDCNT